MQYAQVRAIEHLHPLVRSRRELERVVKDVEAAPGIVLYTLFNRELADELEKSCKRLNIPCVPVLKPILQVFESYLGTPSTPTVAGQHVLDADYFRRIDALNFTMLHDDGHLPRESQRRRHRPGRHQPHVEDADQRSISPIAASRPPTCRWCPACRCRRSSRAPSNGLRGRPGGERRAHRASPPEPRARARRIITSTTMSTARRSPPRSPRRAQLCARHGWPIIDVTRRSIEETAAAIIRLYHDREAPALGGMSSFLQAGRPPLILASGSKSRARGCSKRRGSPSSSSRPGSMSAPCARRSAAKGSLGPHDVAEVLARAKAEAVSELAPQAYVIGADQVLAFGDDDVLQARQHGGGARASCSICSGKTHTLHTAVAVADRRRDHLGGDDDCDAHACASSRRNSSAAISPPPARRCSARSAPISSKSLGIQLFEKIDGDYFSILGLPLIPLLDTLRREGVIEG